MNYFADELVPNFVCGKYLLFICSKVDQRICWRWHFCNSSTIFVRDIKRSVSLLLIQRNKDKFHLLISNVFSVRGLIGSTLVLFCNTGILLAFVLGNYCDYFTTPKVVIAMMILFIALFFFFPESPSFLMKQNKVPVSVAKTVLWRFEHKLTHAHVL